MTDTSSQSRFIPPVVFAPFLTQEESEIFGIPPANLQVFTPRYVNSSWLVSLRVPCLTRLQGKTVFTALESLTIDSLEDATLLSPFAFPCLRSFSAALRNGCLDVNGVLVLLRSIAPKLSSCDLPHAESRHSLVVPTVGNNFRHFGLLGCTGCCVRADLCNLRSAAISVSTKLPVKFPTLSDAVERLHLDFRMIWRPSLAMLLDKKFPTLSTLTVSGPVFGDAARLLGRLLTDKERFPVLTRVRLDFGTTKGSPVSGLVQETRGRLVVEEQV